MDGIGTKRGLFVVQLRLWRKEHPYPFCEVWLRWERGRSRAGGRIQQKQLPGRAQASEPPSFRSPSALKPEAG